MDIEKEFTFIDESQSSCDCEWMNKCGKCCPENCNGFLCNGLCEYNWGPLKCEEYKENKQYTLCNICERFLDIEDEKLLCICDDGNSSDTDLLEISSSSSSSSESESESEESESESDNEENNNKEEEESVIMENYTESNTTKKLKVEVYNKLEELRDSLYRDMCNGCQYCSVYDCYLVNYEGCCCKERHVYFDSVINIIDMFTDEVEALKIENDLYEEEWKEYERQRDIEEKKNEIQLFPDLPPLPPIDLQENDYYNLEQTEEQQLNKEEKELEKQINLAQKRFKINSLKLNLFEIEQDLRDQEQQISGHYQEMFKNFNF